MAEAKSKDNWNHTSTLLALMININRDPKKQRAVKPKELNPHEQKVKDVLRGKGLRILKDVFVDRAPVRSEITRFARKGNNLNNEL
jgi:hypothetical protein